MTNPILGYDIDGQPLRAGDRVVSTLTGQAGQVIGIEPDKRNWEQDDRNCIEWVRDSGKVVCVDDQLLRKLPPKANHEPGSLEEIAKLGWKPNLAPSTADC